MAKYDQFLTEMQIAATVADCVRNRQFSAYAIDEVLTNPGYAEVINLQTAPTPQLVSEFIGVIWQGAAAPMWIQEARSKAPTTPLAIPPGVQFPASIPPVGSAPNPTSVDAR